MDLDFFFSCFFMFLFATVCGWLYLQTVAYISILIFGKPSLESYSNINYTNSTADNGDHLVYSAMYLSMED
jgi:hypothetical protein